MKRTLWLIRGASGAGKTHLATILESSLISSIAISADDFRQDQYGRYVYDPAQNATVHLRCFHQVDELMRSKNYEHVIVHNTFTRRWELDQYYELAERLDWRVSEIVCNNRFPNVHAVPDEQINKQWERFEL